MTMQNPFDFLRSLEGNDAGERLIFQSTLPQNANPFQRQIFGELFNPTFNQFLGALGSQIRAGQAPNLTFTDFLNQQFDPQRALLRLPQFGQGQGGGRTIFNFGG